MAMQMITRLFPLAYALPRLINEGVPAATHFPPPTSCLSQGRTGSCGPRHGVPEVLESLALTTSGSPTAEPLLWKHLRQLLSLNILRTSTDLLYGVRDRLDLPAFANYLIITSSSSSLGFPTTLTAFPIVTEI